MVTRYEQDRQLMKRAAAGEAAAQRAVVHRLMRRARNIARTLIGDPFDADDAAQNAMLEILKSARSYRGENRLESWADRIAVRSSMRVVRERSLRTARTDPSALIEELTSLAPRAGGEHSTARAVIDYLRQLSDDRKTVLVLRHVLEYSVGEIADLTGAPVNTVKDRLLRARQELRKMVRRERLTGAHALRRSG